MPPPRSDPNKLPRTKLVSSRHLDGISDLVVAAPIKQGFIDSFEHVTYETRLRIVMETLFRMRSTSREFSLIKPLLETTELIQSIRSFRLAIVEIETQTKIEKRLVLAVTFDKAWEPYIRLIWNPMGRILDVLFCNCDFYVPATDSSFEDFARWIRENQVETGFFTAATNLSVTDLNYLVEVDRLHRDNAGSPEIEIKAAGLFAADPKLKAAKVRADHPDDTDEIAMEALGALYRLTLYYPTDRGPHGKYLHRAAHGLLDGWKPQPKVQPYFCEWLEWYDGKFGHDTAYETSGGKAVGYDKADIQAGIVSGYDRQMRPITHGCLLLMHVEDPERARNLIGRLKDDKDITTEDPNAAPPKNGIFLNLAFTYRGLKSLEVPAAELRKFPQEFLEGPEQRAGLIGDVLENHPRRWRRPERNWPPASQRGPMPSLPVDLWEIDMVVQLRIASPYPGHDLFTPDGELDPDHPLKDKVEWLAEKASKWGMRLLSVQPMRSRPVPREKVPGPLSGAGSVTEEHFGFADGFSQPVVDDNGGTGDSVKVGEVLLGHANDRGDGATRSNPWLNDGSFLVIRKIGQNVPALQKWVRGQCGGKMEEKDLYAKMVGRHRDGMPLVPIKGSGANDFGYDDDETGSACPLQSHVRRANPRREEHGRKTPRIMRRGMSYGPPFDPDRPEAEADRGLVFMCYQSSIAEQYEVIQRWLNGANSTNLGSWQNDPLTGVRRPDQPRTFRWLNGQEPPVRTKLDEPKTEPFVTLEWLLYLFVPSLPAIEKIARDVREPGAAELEVGNEVLLKLGHDLIERLQLGERLLDAATKLKPFRPILPGWYHDPNWREWFRTWAKLLRRAPSLLSRAVMEQLFRRKPKDIDHIGEAARSWKALLEDLGARDPSERAYGPAIWATIRAEHGGVIRVPYGDPESSKPIEWVVLVASKKLVMDVYHNEKGYYSVEGDGERMDRMSNSVGKNYVGIDEGDDYYAEAPDTNRILMDVEEWQAFDVARECADAVLEQCFDAAQWLAKKRDTKLDLTNRFITPALAGVCSHWFGIPDPRGEYVEPGSWRRLARASDFKPEDRSRCPGDFIAPSRYIFYPDPNPAVKEYGRELGARLNRNVTKMYANMYGTGGRPDAAPIAALVFDAILGETRKVSAAVEPLTAEEHVRIGLVTRNVIGAMTGMLAPTDGNLRGALYGWLKDRTLWRVQHRLVTAEIDPDALAEQRRLLQEWSGADAADADARARRYLRAKNGLEDALMEAMQKRPAPDMVWRTAKRRHWLGDKKGKRVRVGKGEKIFVGIVSATMEDLGKGKRDVYPIFGGERREYDARAKKQPPPLHGCPGYKIAMGTMLGILSALLEKGVIDALPTPLMVRLRDPALADAAE